MARHPKIRTWGKTVTMRPTEEAKRVQEQVAKRDKGKNEKAVTPEEVRRRAMVTCGVLGFPDPDRITLMGQFQLQLGRYRLQTFHWLLENDLGWAAFLVASMKAEGDSNDTNLGINKKQLKEYMEFFPNAVKAIEMKEKEFEEKLKKKKPKLHVEPVASTSATSTVSQPDTDMDDATLLSAVESLEGSLLSPVPSQGATAAMQSPSASKVGDPLPAGWKSTIEPVDHQWIAKALFKWSSSGKLSVDKVELDPSKATQLWYYPPQPRLTTNQTPKVDRYFGHRLFLWMPYRLWNVRFQCPNATCSQNSLTSAGIYPRVRRVLDVSDHYYLATEYLRCGRCLKKLIGWSGILLDQLDVGHRHQFPAILTYQYACDVRVITLMRQRGLGNSSSQLRLKLLEEHSETWLRQSSHYLADCLGYSTAASKNMLIAPTYDEIPKQLTVPGSAWLKLVYCNDVMRRVDEVKAAITSTFGKVLKIDSTKKVVKKLAGRSSGTALWATNVGNEYGQVLMSVLTASEGYGLGPMVAGIVDRYEQASIPPPSILYVDRDCCGNCTLSRMFAPWSDLKIRLDIWHFMRRFSSGCTTDAHQLYGVFMSRLSKCIFEWSSEDLQSLRDAKRTELLQRNISSPTDLDIVRRLSKRELALHCRRQTRGTEETTRLIGDLLEVFTGDQGRDTMGVPLFDSEKIVDIWESQKRHVSCIQDPEGFPLYTECGLVKKGTTQIMSYRCARGSTSLESFHLHLNQFIPGSTASDLHFQAYLLDGLVRWNEDRAKAAFISDVHAPSSYSGLLRHAVNDLSSRVLNRNLVPDYLPPRKYTGEKIGVEYLFQQTGQVLQDFDKDPDSAESAQFEPEEGADADEEDQSDEGFNEIDVDDQTVPPVDSDITPSSPEVPRQKRLDPRPAITEIPPQPTQPDMIDESTTDMTVIPLTTGDQTVMDLDPDDAVGPDGVGGFHKADAMAEFLFQLRDQRLALTNRQALSIIKLWNELTPYDKKPSKLNPRYQPTLKTGRFKSRSATSVTPGVDSTKRCFLGQNTGPAQRPDCNRIMECLISKLCSAYPTSERHLGKTTQRWSLVTRAYKSIRERILSNTLIMERTNLALLEINNTTLNFWNTKRAKDQERQVLEQGIHLSAPSMTAARSLPLPLPRLLATHTAPLPPEQVHEFVLPPITTGDRRAGRKLPLPTESTSATSAKMPRSTTWYHRKVDAKKDSGEFVRTYSKRREGHTYVCGKCKQSRTSERHSQYYGSWYCANTATETEEEWRSSREKCRLEKKARKQENQDDKQ